MKRKMVRKMIRKMIRTVLIATLATGLALTGCGSSASDSGSDTGYSYNEEYNADSMVTVTGEEADMSGYQVYSEAGFAFQYPDAWNELNNTVNLNAGMVNEYGWLAYYIPTDKMEAVTALPDDVSDEKKTEVYTEAQEAEIPICAICRVNKSDDVTAQFKEAFDDDYPEEEILCKIGKNTYYFLYNKTFDSSALTEEDAADVQALIDTIEEFKDSLVIFPPAE